MNKLLSLFNKPYIKIPTGSLLILYAELSDLFEDVDCDFSSMTIEEIVEELKSAEKDKEFYSDYAGGNFCGEIYEHVDGKLIEVSITKFFTGIAKYIKENWI